MKIGIAMRDCEGDILRPAPVNLAVSKQAI